jgi:hypothetical protein
MPPFSRVDYSSTTYLAQFLARRLRTLSFPVIAILPNRDDNNSFY